MKIENLVVVGGGSAGWLTALILQSYQPSKKITVIESDDIGILGAGEGTVPHFIDVLDKINIPVSDIIKHAKGTLKNGIKFTNWNGDNRDYFHQFGPANGLNFKQLNNIYHNKTLLGIIAQLWKDEDLYEINFSGKLAKKNKVPLSRHNNIDAFRYDPITRFARHSNFALHFDARLLAEFLKTVAISRGIIRVEGIVDDFFSDEAGNITSISLESKKDIPCDFVFDCTGFKRLIIGKHFKSTWKSHSDVLPVNTAIPFFIENETDNIEPYTEAIAMKHGWVWRIPVQGRYGCGYVFDDNYTDIETAKEEIREYFGPDVIFPRTFKFNAGCYEKIWINNCVAVGLASGFIEPLEATSIWLSTSMLIDLAESFDQLEEMNIDNIDHYNETFLERTDDIVDFLCLHYLTQRKDSKFWEEYPTRPFSSRINRLVVKWQSRIPSNIDIRNSMFSLDSWMSVLVGIQRLKKEHITSYVVANNLQQLIEQQYNIFKLNQDHVLESCLDHYEFLKVLKNE
jgi:tryptophan halogenase